MDVMERFGECSGLSATAIGERFESDDLDELCLALLHVFAERTDKRRLSRLPTAIRVTMYGDYDVSDHVIRYDDTGYRIDPPAEGDVLDAHLRCEHWEDAVRLLNADIPASTVLFSSRVTFDGQKEDGPKRTAALAWMAAVNFADQRPEDRAGGLLYRLQYLTKNQPDAIPAFVEAVGLQAIARSRAHVMGQTFLEVGAKEEVQGSYLRFDVVADPPVSSRVEWAPESGAITVTDPDPASLEDPEGGVTMRYADAQTFLDVAGLKVLPTVAMAAGKVGMRASAERAANYQKAMMHLARHIS